jgi:outer membrane immunogenic protein
LSSGAPLVPERLLHRHFVEVFMTRVGLVAVLALATASGAASAADMSRPSYFAATASGYGWTGPYIGGNLGYQWGEVSNNPTKPSGLTGGIQGGYLWQNGRFVFGGEADLQLSDADNTFAPWKFSNPWFGTLRGRAGVAVNNFLIYGTAGFALGELTAETVGLATESHTNVGWTVGAGVEMGLPGNWTAKAEYLYVDLASRSFSLTGAKNDFATSVFRLGVNYHF